MQFTFTIKIYFTKNCTKITQIFISYKNKYYYFFHTHLYIIFIQSLSNLYPIFIYSYQYYYSLFLFNFCIKNRSQTYEKLKILNSPFKKLKLIAKAQSKQVNISCIIFCTRQNYSLPKKR